jgi:hypothetical protein
MVEAASGGRVSGISLELRGRLEPDELAFTWHVRSRLQLGKPIRLLAFSVLIFLVGGFGLSIYLSSRISNAVPGGSIVGFVLMLAALFDVSGLTLVRHRIMARLLRRPAHETVARLDDDGVRYAPVGQETSHMSFGWPLLDVLSLPEGVIVALRKAAVPILFLPKRALPVASRRVIIALALAHGAQVLDGPRGRPVPASPGDVNS